MSCTIDVSQSIWRTTFSETLTNRDLLEVARRIGALRENGIVRNGLVDLRTLCDMDIDYPTLNTITLEAQSHRPRSEVRTAIIANNPIQYGIARMVQTLLNGRERDVHVIENEKAALDWLQSDSLAEMNEENPAVIET